MQKRLLAAAVAGALAAPAIALAQSTVQIYGQTNFQYGVLEQGRNRPNVDYFESTGTYLGFRGQENLGGSLTAWFQCETTMDIRAFDQTGLCSRNSGLGFRGGFGNVWGGRWHTPFSRIYSLTSTGVDETGNLGFARIHGSSGSTSFAEQGTGDAGSASRQQFRRRESCLVTYETPNFGGFMVGAAVSCGNAASDLSGGANDGRNNTEPRLWSVAGTYVRGPLAAGIGYQKHQDVGTFNSATAPNLDDEGWGATIKYTFGPVAVSVQYMNREWDTSTATRNQDLKNETWTVGAEWRIAGPHTLMGAYGDTSKSKGNSLVGIGDTGLGGAMASGSGTGYNAYTLAYQYNFSKRTEIKIGWVRYENDSNSTALRLYNTAALNAGDRGIDQDAYSFSIRHRF